MWQVLLVCALVVGALGDACTSAGGYDLSAFKDNTHKWEWRQPSCGISGKCTAPGCCAFCQLWDSDGQQDGACLGTQWDSFTPISGGIKMKYTGGDPVPQSANGPAGPREAFVDLVCGSSEWDQSNFVEAQGAGSDGAYAYNMTVSTSAICGGGGIGGGGYFLIILFAVILPVYLIGGVLWNKFKEGKEGQEVIPNYDFWVATPGYFIDGCTFTKNKVLGLCGRSGYDTVG